MLIFLLLSLLVLTYHIRCIAIARSLNFTIFSASFMITLLSPDIALSIKKCVPFSLARIMTYSLLLLLLLSSSSSSSSLSSPSSALLSPSCRVFIHIFPRQTMSLGNTVFQLFCHYYLWCLYR